MALSMPSMTLWNPGGVEVDDADEIKFSGTVTTNEGVLQILNVAILCCNISATLPNHSVN